MFVGVRNQRGYGRTQRGNGIGGVLKRLFRSALPFLLRGGKQIGRQAIKTGINVGQDVLDGKSVKSSVTARVKETANDLAKKAVDHVAQTGRGIKRPAKGKSNTRKKVLKRNTSKPKRQVHNDIFGA